MAVRKGPAMDVSRTISCVWYWDALVLGAMLEEHGVQVHRPDEVAPLTMVATGTLDGIMAAVAQLIHKFPGSGPVVIEGEDRVYIGEEARVADPAPSQAIPRRCSASTASGSQCKLPAMAGDHLCHVHAEARGKTGQSGPAPQADQDQLDSP
jgi:hypothetical protein